jgi:uncharacterized protein (DUF1697 family)
MSLLTPHVVLLRGLNIGKRRFPMADLVRLIEAGGGRDARTYIASGNAVCLLPPEQVSTFAAALADTIEARFGFRSPVVVRSHAELQATVDGLPFVDAPEEELAVAFLADTPSADRVAGLDPHRSRGDQFAVVGRDVYLHLTRGFAETRLTNDWLDRSLATVSTARNWRTVLTLLAMAGEAASRAAR